MDTQEAHLFAKIGRSGKENNATKGNKGVNK
jgi:hypothetical protein